MLQPCPLTLGRRLGSLRPSLTSNGPGPSPCNPDTPAQRSFPGRWISHCKLHHHTCTLRTRPCLYRFSLWSRPSITTITTQSHCFNKRSVRTDVCSSCLFRTPTTMASPHEQAHCQLLAQAGWMRGPPRPLTPSPCCPQPPSWIQLF